MCYAIVWLAVLTFILVSGVSQGTAFGDLGSLAGYCGTLIYLFASLAAPVWAYRRGAGSLFIAAAGLVGTGVMAVVFYYSLVPFPTGSARVFAYLFFGAVAVLFVIGIAAQPAPPAIPAARRGHGGHPGRGVKTSTSCAGRRDP